MMRAACETNGSSATHLPGACSHPTVSSWFSLCRGEHLTWEPSLWGRWFSAFFPPVAEVSRLKLLAHRAVSPARPLRL